MLLHDQHWSSHDYTQAMLVHVVAGLGLAHVPHTCASECLQASPLPQVITGTAVLASTVM
jgi:hypothetical protein